VTERNLARVLDAIGETFGNGPGTALRAGR